ncbi:MAG TPA: sigma-70 family RNA polymerase sigma factor [Candidatus Kryptonia bacterium]
MKDLLTSGSDIDFEVVYNRYKTAVYRFCRRMLNDDDAKDIVQEIFMKFLETPFSYDGDARVKGWLFKAARNRCLNVIRDKEKFTLAADDETAPAENREFNDTDTVVKALLDKMPLEYREILIMREWSELSYDEIAEALDTTASSVKSKIFKARKKAREIYEKLYGEK